MKNPDRCPGCGTDDTRHRPGCPTLYEEADTMNHGRHNAAAVVTWLYCTWWGESYRTIRGTTRQGAFYGIVRPPSLRLAPGVELGPVI